MIFPRYGNIKPVGATHRIRHLRDIMSDNVVGTAVLGVPFIEITFAVKFYPLVRCVEG